MFPQANGDMVNCAQLRVSRCCRLVAIKATGQAAVGIPLPQPAFWSGGTMRPFRPLAALFLNGSMEVHTTSIGTDW